MSIFNRRKFLKATGSGLALGSAGLGLSQASTEAAAVQWKVEGNYFESCTCDNVCPCLLLKDPTVGSCTAFVGWGIDKGHYGDVGLDGLKVALWLHAPGNLLNGNWRVALYIDDQASDAQYDALHAMWGGEGGGHLGVISSLISDVLSVKKANISILDTAEKKHLVVEGVGENEIYPMKGEDGNDIVVSKTPLAVAPQNPITLHESKKARYHDNGIDWYESGKAGLSSAFQYGPA